MKVILIAAVGSRNEIGRNNDLPWKLKDDMKFFRDTTMGHPVIMGRKNYDSIPPKYRPLPGRTNIVVTRDPDAAFENCWACTSVENAIAHCRSTGAEKAFLIGGAQIYDYAVEKGLVDEMLITHVHTPFDRQTSAEELAGGLHEEVYFSGFIGWGEGEVVTMFLKSEGNQYSFGIRRYTK